MILVDSGGLYAALVDTEPDHDPCRNVLATEQGPFVLSPFVLCEIDYMLLSRVGTATELELLDDVASGAYFLVPFTADDVSEARAIVHRFADLRIGLADASIVLLAERLETNRVLTVDHRHFRALRTPRGDPFVVLPADA